MLSARDDYQHMRNISDNFRSASDPPSYVAEIDTALSEIDRLRRENARLYRRLEELEGAPENSTVRSSTPY